MGSTSSFNHIYSNQYLSICHRVIDQSWDRLRFVKWVFFRVYRLLDFHESKPATSLERWLVWEIHPRPKQVTIYPGSTVGSCCHLRVLLFFWMKNSTGLSAGCSMVYHLISPYGSWWNGVVSASHNGWGPIIWLTDHFPSCKGGFIPSLGSSDRCLRPAVLGERFVAFLGAQRRSLGFLGKDQLLCRLQDPWRSLISYIYIYTYIGKHGGSSPNMEELLNKMLEGMALWPSKKWGNNMILDHWRAIPHFQGDPRLHLAWIQWTYPATPVQLDLVIFLIFLCVSQHFLYKPSQTHHLVEECWLYLHLTFLW